MNSASDDPITIPPGTGLGQLLLATRVQVLAVSAIILSFFFVEWLSDAMLEALRFALLDPPHQAKPLPIVPQVLWIALALILTGVAIKASSRAMIASTRHALLRDKGWTGFAAHAWPDLLAIIPAASVIVCGAMVSAGNPEATFQSDALPFIIFAISGGLPLLLVPSTDPKAAPGGERPTFVLRVVLAIWFLTLAAYVAVLLIGIAAQALLQGDVYADEFVLGAAAAPVVLFIAELCGQFVSKETASRSTVFVSAAIAGASLLIAAGLIALYQTQPVLGILTSCMAALTFAVLLICAMPFVDHANTFLAREPGWLSHFFPFARLSLAVTALVVVVTFAVEAQSVIESFSSDGAKYVEVADRAAIAAAFGLFFALLPFGLFRLGANTSVSGAYPGMRRATHTRSLVALIDRPTQWWLSAVLVAGPVISWPFFFQGNTEFFWALGPVTIVLLWCASSVAVFFALALFGSAQRVWTLVLLFVTALLLGRFNLNDNHELAAAPELGGVFAPTPGPTAVGNEANQSLGPLDMKAWLASRPDLADYDEYPVYLIATEGGGLRAAYFTSAVLGALQDEFSKGGHGAKGSFSDHVLAISSVSGGSLGAVNFSAAVANEDRNALARIDEKSDAASPDATPPAIYFVSVTRDKRHFLTVPGQARHVTVWSSGNFREDTRRWEKPKEHVRLALEPEWGQTSAGAISPDGALVVVGTYAGAVAACTVPKCKSWEALAHAEETDPANDRHRINAVAFAPDGKLLAAASMDGRVRVWRKVGIRFDPMAIDVSPPIADVPVAANAVAFFETSDGTMALAAGFEDGAVRLLRPWDTKNPVVEKLTGPVLAVAGKGDRFLAAGNDAKIWRIAGGQVAVDEANLYGERLYSEKTYSQASRIWSAEFLEDDQVGVGKEAVLLASSDGSVSIWRPGGLDSPVPLRNGSEDAYTAAALDRGRILVGYRNKGATIWRGDNTPGSKASFTAETDSYEEAAKRTFAHDLLSPSLAGLLFADALQRIVPWPIPEWDRSSYLATAFERAASASWKCKDCDYAPDYTPEMPLSSLTESGAPALFLNTTEVESGGPYALGTRSLPIRPGEDDPTTASLSEEHLPPVVLNERLPADELKRVKLSTAAALSARFPYLMPSAKMKLADPRHDRRFVDGGYFENSGTYILSQILGDFVEKAILEFREPANSDGLRPYGNDLLISSRVHVIVIQSSPNSDPDTRSTTPPELLSPPVALLNTRQARAAVSYGELVRMARSLNDQVTAERCANKLKGRENPPSETMGRSDDAFQKCRLEEGERIRVSRIRLSDARDVGEKAVPLTWVLSKAARKHLDDRLDGLKKELANAATPADEALSQIRLKWKFPDSLRPSFTGLLEEPSVDASFADLRMLTLHRYSGYIYDGLGREQGELPPGVKILDTEIQQTAILPASSLPASPNKALIATSLVDNSIRIWSDNGTELGAPLKGHEGRVTSVEFSRDGRYLVTASEDGTARLWDVTTRKQVGEPLFHGEAVLHAALSETGEEIATTTRSDVRLWTRGSKTPLLVCPYPNPYIRVLGLLSALFVPPNSARAAERMLLMVPRHGPVVVIDRATCKARSTSWAAQTGLQTAERTHAEYARDGTMLVETFAGGKVKLWNTNGGARNTNQDSNEAWQSFELPESFTGSNESQLSGAGGSTGGGRGGSARSWASFSPSGRYLTFGSEGGARAVFRLLKNNELSPFRIVLCSLVTGRAQSSSAKAAYPFPPTFPAATDPGPGRRLEMDLSNPACWQDYKNARSRETEPAMANASRDGLALIDR